MTVTPTRDTTAVPAPAEIEVLIEEARRRGRRHRAAVVAVAVSVTLVAAVLASVTSAGSRPVRHTAPRPLSAIPFIAAARVSGSGCPLAAQARAGLTRSSKSYPFRVLGTYLVDRQQIFRDVGYFHDVQGRHHLWTMCYVTGADVSYSNFEGPINGRRAKPIHYALWLYIRPNNGEFALVAQDRPFSARIAG